jgi:hypothetical protein
MVIVIHKSNELIDLRFLLTVHLDILCNEKELYELNCVCLFNQSTSTCFGQIYCPSSGGIHCICTAIGTCYKFRLIGCWSGQDENGFVLSMLGL